MDNRMRIFTIKKFLVLASFLFLSSIYGQSYSGPFKADGSNLPPGAVTRNYNLGITVNSTVTANLFSGSGASLTALNAGSISTGTLGVARGGSGTSTVFTQGRIIYAGTSGIYSQDSNLTWSTSNAQLVVSGNASVAGTVTINSLIVTGNISLPSGVIVSGVYTPTLTNVLNLEGSTAFQCQYMRVGSVVTVSGKLSLDPILTATSTQLGISLPIASNIGANEDCAGMAFAPTIAGLGGAILGDATNDRALLQFISSDPNNNALYFTFTYRIL